MFTRIVKKLLLCLVQGLALAKCNYFLIIKCKFRKTNYQIAFNLEPRAKRVFKYLWIPIVTQLRVFQLFDVEWIVQMIQGICSSRLFTNLRQTFGCKFKKSFPFLDLKSLRRLPVLLMNWKPNRNKSRKTKASINKEICPQTGKGCNEKREFIKRSVKHGKWREGWRGYWEWNGMTIGQNGFLSENRIWIMNKWKYDWMGKGIRALADCLIACASAGNVGGTLPL